VAGCSIDAIDHWGSTADERREPFACDELLPHPDKTVFRAVDVDAPAETVFRWLCQLRVAPYSYDWIDNLGRRSPRRLTPGTDELELGQTFMTIFRLAHFEPGSSITVTADSRVFGRIAGTYRVVPKLAGGSRLVVKLLVIYPRGIAGRVLAAVLPAGDLVMMRRQLLNLKALAEASSGR
jgi:hypothetical protein